MANYCNEKNRYCVNCNERGYCNTTGCIYSTVTITNIPTKHECDWIGNLIAPIHIGRTCQICGNSTSSSSMYICEDCKRKLNTLMQFMK